jgi:hypothetical protein
LWLSLLLSLLCPHISVNGRPPPQSRAGFMSFDRIIRTAFVLIVVLASTAASASIDDYAQVRPATGAGGFPPGFIRPNVTADDAPCGTRGAAAHPAKRVTVLSTRLGR